jgi:hypothetical protein
MSASRRHLAAVPAVHVDPDGRLLFGQQIVGSITDPQVLAIAQRRQDEQQLSTSLETPATPDPGPRPAQLSTHSQAALYARATFATTAWLSAAALLAALTYRAARWLIG